MAHRLVNIDEHEVPPDFVFDRIREVHPDAEVVCYDEGYWMIGIVRPFTERVEAGKRMLLRYEKMGAEKDDPVYRLQIRKAILMTQGFGYVVIVRWRGGDVDWNGPIEEFRERNFLYEKFEGKDAETTKHIEGNVIDDVRSRARAVMVDRFEADKRYLFRILHGNPAPVAVGANIT